ncbi:unnamed protein product [Closterium sp. Naga37s-1]|nr:unnamed protein product [Closterium sp. Naga37s-1]
MGGRSPRSPGVVERWAVEVGKDTHRLLEFVLQEPEVASQRVSLVLVYVMSEVPCASECDALALLVAVNSFGARLKDSVPCALPRGCVRAVGISYNVSQLESRVADIHEAHVMDTILKPLVMELHFKKKVPPQPLSHSRAPSRSLASPCLASLTDSIAFALSPLLRRYSPPSFTAMLSPHSIPLRVASLPAARRHSARGARRQAGRGSVSGRHSRGGVAARGELAALLPAPQPQLCARLRAPPRAAPLLRSPLHPPALTRDQDSAIAQAPTPPRDPRSTSPSQPQSRRRAQVHGQVARASGGDLEAGARLTPRHSSSACAPSVIPASPDHHLHEASQQRWGRPINGAGGAVGGDGGEGKGRGGAEPAREMHASARGGGVGSREVAVSSWAERQAGAAVVEGSYARSEGGESRRSVVDEAAEAWTGSSKGARRGRGACRESEREGESDSEMVKMRQELHEARCMVQQLHAEVDMARAAAAEAVALAAAAQGEREMLQYEFREYSLHHLHTATDGFSEQRLIGQGSSGRVYRGEINHTPVAIRRLDDSLDSALHEFDKEVRLGSRLRHPNIVLLLGCCRSPPCIVYELMPSGSLYHRLLCTNNSPPLLWHQRFDIAANIAAALAHLHCREHPIVHFDLKPTTVLLGRQLEAKITDVGVARMMKRTAGDDSMSGPMDALGFGYACPELLRSNAFCSRTDVYAFGMLLYDLLGATTSGGRVKGLIAQLDEAAAEGDLALLHSLTDPAARWPSKVAMEVAALARQCTAVKRRDRPDVAGGVLPVLQQLRPAVESFRAAEEAEAATLALQQQLVLQRRQAQLQGMEGGGGGAEEVVWEVAPNAFRCPITLEVMQWPVVAADGHTYEESALREWLSVSSLSPKTLMPLPHLHLTPNHALRSLIRDWMERKKLSGAPPRTPDGSGAHAGGAVPGG